MSIDFAADRTASVMRPTIGMEPSRCPIVSTTEGAPTFWEYIKRQVGQTS